MIKDSYHKFSVEDRVKHQRHRPVLIVAVSFAFGVLLESFGWFSFGAMLIINIILMATLAVLRSKCRRLRVGLLVMLIASTGYQHAVVSSMISAGDVLNQVKYVRGKVVVLRGHVMSDPEQKVTSRGNKTTFILKANQLSVNDRNWPVTGRVWVNVFRHEPIKYGQSIILHGKLHTPYEFNSDGNFSYKQYLANRHIYTMMSVSKKSSLTILEEGKGSRLISYIMDWRQRGKLHLHKFLSEKEAGLMQAILFGDRSKIPPSIKQLFIYTGTAHVLAISGLHVGIISAIFLAFFTLIPIPRRGAYMFTIVAVSIYIIMAGARPSIIRAGMMINIFLLGLVIRRKSDPLNAMAMAACLILYMNPLSLFDIGFQLSFISVYSILSFAPKINVWMGKSATLKNLPNQAKKVINMAGVSAIVAVGVGGLVAYYFQIVTPVSILANVCIIPLITMVVGLGLGLVVSAFIDDMLAMAFAYCLKAILNLMAGVIYILYDLPGAYWRFDRISIGHVCGYYLLVLVIFYCPWRKCRAKIIKIFKCFMYRFHRR